MAHHGLASLPLNERIATFGTAEDASRFTREGGQFTQKDIRKIISRGEPAILAGALENFRDTRVFESPRTKKTMFAEAGTPSMFKYLRLRFGVSRDIYEHVLETKTCSWMDRSCIEYRDFVLMMATMDALKENS